MHYSFNFNGTEMRNSEVSGDHIPSEGQTDKKGPVYSPFLEMLGKGNMGSLCISKLGRK